jgi:hypothetical protein
MNSETTTKRPSFGIIGAEFYFPKNYVDQTELEKVLIFLIKVCFW